MKSWIILTESCFMFIIILFIITPVWADGYKYTQEAEALSKKSGDKAAADFLNKVLHDSTKKSGFSKSEIGNLLMEEGTYYYKADAHDQALESFTKAENYLKRADTQTRSHLYLLKGLSHMQLDQIQSGIESLELCLNLQKETAKPGKMSEYWIAWGANLVYNLLSVDFKKTDTIINDLFDLDLPQVQKVGISAVAGTLFHSFDYDPAAKRYSKYCLEFIEKGGYQKILEDLIKNVDAPALKLTYLHLGNTIKPYIHEYFSLINANCIVNEKIAYGRFEEAIQLADQVIQRINKRNPEIVDVLLGNFLQIDDPKFITEYKTASINDFVAMLPALLAKVKTHDPGDQKLNDSIIKLVSEYKLIDHIEGVLEGVCDMMYHSILTGMHLNKAVAYKNMGDYEMALETLNSGELAAGNNLFSKSMTSLLVSSELFLKEELGGVDGIMEALMPILEQSMKELEEPVKKEVFKISRKIISDMGESLKEFFLPFVENTFYEKEFAQVYRDLYKSIGLDSQAYYYEVKYYDRIFRKITRGARFINGLMNRFDESIPVLSKALNEEYRKQVEQLFGKKAEEIKTKDIFNLISNKVILKAIMKDDGNEAGYGEMKKLMQFLSTLSSAPPEIQMDTVTRDQWLGHLTDYHNYMQKNYELLRSIIFQVNWFNATKSELKQFFDFVFQQSFELIRLPIILLDLKMVLAEGNFQHSNFTESNTYAKSTVGLSRKLGNAYMEAKGLYLMGANLFTLEDADGSVELLNQSVKLLKENHIEDGVHVMVLNYLGKAHRKLGQLKQSLDNYEKSIQMIENIRKSLLGSQYGGSLIEQQQEIYNGYMDLLFELQTQYPNKRYDEKALEIFEKKQSRLLLKQVGMSEAKRFSGVPDNIRMDELDLETKIMQVRQSRLSLLSKPAHSRDNNKIKELDLELAFLRKKSNTLWGQIRKKYPKYADLKNPVPIKSNQLQQLLSPNELVIVYNVGSQKPFVWFIDQKSLNFETLDCTGPQLGLWIAEYRSKMLEAETLLFEQNRVEKLKKHEQEQLHPKAQNLFNVLIPEKFTSKLSQYSKIIIIPTGGLYDLPFESLRYMDGEGKNQYLVETHALSYLSSVSLLKLLRRSKDNSSPRAKYPYLAFANPKFNCGNAKAPDEEKSKNVKISKLRSARMLKIISNGEAVATFFKQLPETEQEVKEISKYLNPPQKSNPLQLKEKASVATIQTMQKEKYLSDYQYIHFATHAVLPGEISTVSQPALVLSCPFKQGFLTMGDIFGLDMNADLVTLSACNTGRGENVQGEGVMGMTRSFLFAGASAVNVTLWAVESNSIKDLCIGMYKAISSGQPISDALRTSKLEMIQNTGDGEFQHPYFWSPMILFGDD